MSRFRTACVTGGPRRSVPSSTSGNPMNLLHRLARRAAAALCTLGLAFAPAAFAATPDAILGLDDGFDPGVNGPVDLVAQQADGKLLIVGRFDYAGGGQAFGLARLGVDGRLDAGFQPRLNGAVTKLLPLADGRVLIGGYFSKVDDVQRYYFAALKPDGRLDETFPLQLGINESLQNMTRLADGGILLSGGFMARDGMPPTTLLRLHADGTPDTGFVPFFVKDDWYGSVYALAEQPDGKLVIAGYIEPPDGSSPMAFARLNADGSQDPTFEPLPEDLTWAVLFAVQSMAVLGDGSIVAGGGFSLPGSGVGDQVGLLKFDRDGHLDPAFRPNPAGTVSALLAEPDGHLLVAGGFTQIGGASIARVARLGPDGSVDAAFSSKPNAAVKSMILQADGKIVLGGAFTRVAGEERQNLVRLESDGRVEKAMIAGAEPLYPGTDATPRCIVQLPDQKLVIGCGFSYVGIDNMSMARLRADGGIDPGFVAPVLEPGFSNAVDVIVPQADGKLLIGGRFVKVNGVDRPGLARLNADGSLDPDFAPANWVVGGTPWARAIAVQSDGRVAVAGWNDTGSAHAPVMARFRADGTRDTGFHVPVLDDPVEVVQPLPDGRLLVAGFFSTVDGVTRNRIARLKADGTLDAGFVPPTETVAGGSVITVQSLPDGRLVIGGQFSIGGQLRQLARLRPDGALDTGFAPPAVNGSLLGVVAQSDGSLTIAGNFTQVDGAARRYLARLRADGSYDASFDVAVADWVTALAQQADGKLLIAGDFRSVDGRARSHIARLPAATGASRSLTIDAGGDLRWSLDGASPTPAQVRFDVSYDGTNWAPLGSGRYAAGVWRLGDTALPRGIDFRVRALGTIAGNGGATGNASGSLLESVRFARLYDGTTHTVTPQAGSGGSLDPDTPVAVYAGSRAHFRVIAQAGYVIDDVGGCGGHLDGDVYTTAPVDGDCTVGATFRPAGATDRLFADGFDSAMP